MTITLCRDASKRWIYIEPSASPVATLTPRKPRRGFLAPKPVFIERAFEVEIMDYGSSDPATPIFAASFFSPTDAKSAIRAAFC
jgi:hypothetical protein